MASSSASTLRGERVEKNKYHGVLSREMINHWMLIGTTTSDMNKTIIDKYRKMTPILTG